MQSAHVCEGLDMSTDYTQEQGAAGKVRVTVLLEPWQCEALEKNKENRGAPVSAQVRIAVSKYLDGQEQLA